MSKDRILLLDPFENVLNIYKLVLEEEDFQVDTLSDLKEALPPIAEKRFSIIITEYFPPFYDIFMWIQAVKNTAPETYVIMNSSTDIDDLSYEKLFSIGLDDYLLKPYAPGKLLAHVKKAIRQQAVIRKNQEREKLSSLVDPIAYKDQQIIFNQSFFRTLIRQEIKKAKRHQQPLSLLLLKLPTKETMGCQYEFFYRNLLKILRNSIREEDILGRENGHLGIILNQTDQTGSQILGQRLSRLVQSHPSLKLEPSKSSMLKDLSFQNVTFSSQGEACSELLTHLLKIKDSPGSEKSIQK